MAVIRKKIENLKVGKEYIATVRAKNTDLNVYSDFTDSIRFVVPSDSTIPEVLQNFRLFASYKNVMFVFDNSNERDVVAYEYELYHQDDITGPEPFEINSGADPVISGVGYSNVISVPLTEDYIQGYSSINTTVDGDGNEVVIYYYGRVRAIDSSNNIGDWTPIQESEDTKLIDEEFIVNLTASKITAGTIKASEIILAQAGASTTITTPANVSVLRSANYNGTYDSGTSTWTPGTQGWIVAGTGYAEFDSAVIRGGLKAGSVFINTNNRWNADTSGNPYASGNVNEGYFKAGSSTKYVEWNPATDTLNIAGNLQSATGTFVGSVTIGTGNAIFKADSNGIYLGNATFGSAPFRVDMNGALVATNATISGNITANALVAGISISSPVINSGSITGTSINIGPLDNNGIGNFRADSTGSVIAKDFKTATSGERLEIGVNLGSGDEIRLIGSTGRVTSIRNPRTINSVNYDFRLSGPQGSRIDLLETGSFQMNSSLAITSGILSAPTVSGTTINAGSISGNSANLNITVSGVVNFITGSYTSDIGDAYMRSFYMQGGDGFPAGADTGILPGFLFNNDLDTGMYRRQTNQVVLVGGGTWGLGVSNGQAVIRAVSGSATGALQADGFGLIYVNTSKASRKKNIEDLENSLDIIKLLRPRQFVFKPFDYDNPDAAALRDFDRQYGFIAEEVAEVSKVVGLDLHESEPVTTVDLSIFFEGLDKSDITEYNKKVEEIKNSDEYIAAELRLQEELKDLNSYVPSYWKHPHFIALAVAAIKELSEKIEALEKIIQGDVNE